MKYYPNVSLFLTGILKLALVRRALLIDTLVVGQVFDRSRLHRQKLQPLPIDFIWTRDESIAPV